MKFDSFDGARKPDECDLVSKGWKRLRRDRLLHKNEVPYVKEEIIMKKLIVLAAAALMAAGAQAAYKDGSYTGEGKGRESQIQVQVDVKGGKVAAVKVLKHGETEMIFAAAAETLCPAIVAKNGVDGVESVAGATLSSDGIKAAVKDALSKAQ
jgi:uncharacterized protein with FMN-binding domain